MDKNYKNILIAVSGLTPQIITETMYYLMVVKKIYLSEVHIITTKTGEERIKNNLLGKAAGPYFDFCREYGFEPTEIKFEIHLIFDMDGKPLEDIRTTVDNESTARTIIKIVYEHTRREDIRVFVSLAGGRKTMSAYIALALQLFGREQDRLTHVLVWPPQVESEKNFYFPPKNPDQKIQLSSGKSIPAKEVKIELAEIPFIRLRSTIQDWLGDNLENYLELIRYSQFAIDEMKTQVKAIWSTTGRKLTIQFGEKKFETKKVPPKLAAVYHAIFKSEIPKQLQFQEKELKELYTTNYSYKTYDNPHYKISWIPDQIQKDISSINNDYLKPILPEPLYRLVKISAQPTPMGNQYFILLPYTNRKIQ